MRFIKFLFNLVSAIVSFAGVIYLFQLYQDFMSDAHSDDDGHQFDQYDSNDSSPSASPEKTGLNDVYYRTMDPEEISESD